MEAVGSNPIHGTGRKATHAKIFISERALMSSGTELVR